MRGHTATKVWPEGHLLSSHEERRQRRAKGVPPLGIPRQLAGFPKEKAGKLLGDSKGGNPLGTSLPSFFV